MNADIYDLPEPAEEAYVSALEDGAPGLIAFTVGCRIAVAEELRRLATGVIGVRGLRTPDGDWLHESAIRARADELDPEGAR